MVFRQSRSERFSAWASHYILCKNLFHIVSPVRSTDRFRCRNPWKSRFERASAARSVRYIISRGSPDIFVARRENLGERWHHSSMWDQGRRRACRTLLSKDLLSARSSARALNTESVFLFQQLLSVISHTMFID